jgi:hypothetical protein
MGNNIADILAKKSAQEPEEFAIVREFVQEKLSVNPKLSLQNITIVITMPNSAAASSLQLQLFELKKQLSESTKLQIRIG